MEAMFTLLPGMLIAFSVILDTCHGDTFAMNHAYLTRMGDELPSHCQVGTECIETSSDDVYTIATLPYIQDEIYRIQPYSCCSNCYCGQRCEKYRNCCPAALLQLYSDGQYVDEIPYDCVSPVYKTEHIFRGLLMIKLCLGSATSPMWYDDKLKCEQRNIENIDEVTPVVSNDTGNIYVNKYCARCNEGNPNVMKWNPYIALVEWTNVINMKNYTNCQWKDIHKVAYDPNSELDVYFEPPQGWQNPYNLNCRGPIIASCNVTGLWEHHDPFYEFACNAYRSVYLREYSIGYSVERRLFGNVFCAICNGVSPTNTTCSVDLSKPDFCPGYSCTYMARFYYDGETYLTPSFASAHLVDVNNTCPDTDFHDPLNDICRPLMCPKYTTYDDGKCIVSLSGVLLGNLVFIIKVGPIPTQPSDNELAQLSQTLKTDVFLVDRQPYLIVSQVLMLTEDGPHGTVSSLVFIFNTDRIYRVSIGNRYANGFLEMMRTNPTRYFMMNGADLTVRIDYVHNVRIGRNIGDRPVNFELVNIDNGAILTNFYSEPYAYYTIQDHLISLVKKVDFCAALRLRENEYDTINDCSIRIKKTGAVFYCTQYDVEEDGVKLCVDDYLNAIPIAQSNAPQFSCFYQGIVMVITVFMSTVE